MVSATKLMGMALLASGSVFWGGPALADDSSALGLGRPEPAPEEVVSDLLDHAGTAFDEGSFKEATDYYRAALRLSPNRATLCNLGVAARLAGNVTEAAQALSECLAEPLPPLAPGDEDERARRVQYRSDLEVVRQQTGSIEVTTTPGAEVVIDDLPRGTAPLAAIFVLPGAHTVTVRDARGEARRVVEVGAGKRVTIELEPKGSTAAPKAQRAAPIVVPPPPEKSDAMRPLVVAGIVVTSVAYAAGLATLGVPPFEDAEGAFDPERVRQQILTEALPPLARVRPGCPPELEDLLQSLCAKLEEDRPPSLENLSEMLDHTLAACVAHRKAMAPTSPPLPQDPADALHVLLTKALAEQTAAGHGDGDVRGTRGPIGAARNPPPPPRVEARPRVEAPPRARAASGARWASSA